MTPLARRPLCASVFFAVLLMTGCASNMGPLQNGGVAPTVAAVAVQVNGNAPNRKQEVQFNGPMDPATINGHSFQVTDSGGRPMPGSVTYNSDFDIASFQPSPALRPGATYTATITTAAASAAGVHLAKPYSYTFTTRAKVDASPILVLSVSPAANESCVSTTTLIIVTFDEAPDASTIMPNNFTVTGPGGAIPVKLSTNVTTTQVVLTPTSPLPSGAITVTVNNVGDLADVMMTAPYTWSFSTACGSGGVSSGGATTQYQAPLFSESALDSAMNGQITVDTSGNTTVRLTGAPARTTYTVQFCPAVDQGSTYAPPACFDVTTVSSDSGGSGTATAKFPRPGDWAGDFYVNNSAGKAAYQTFLAPNLSNQTYLSTLLPATSTNGEVDTTGSPQDPLSSGTVTYSNGSLVFSVNGASPNSPYATVESETIYIGSSGSYELTTFTTDAKGNGSSTTQVAATGGGGGDLFEVVPQFPRQSAGFIGGFSVPN